MNSGLSRIRIGLASPDVRSWRDSEASHCTRHVRFLRYTGLVRHACETSKMTLMYGPAARRKRFSSICRLCGLASMYSASRWSVTCSGPSWISARAISLADRPRTGHSGHQCSHAPGRPILHLVSSSRRPRRETGCGATSLRAPCLCSSFVCAVRRFLRPGAPRTGAVKAGRRAWPASGAGVSTP